MPSISPSESACPDGQSVRLAGRAAPCGSRRAPGEQRGRACEWRPDCPWRAESQGCSPGPRGGPAHRLGSSVQDAALGEVRVVSAGDERVLLRSNGDGERHAGLPRERGGGIDAALLAEARRALVDPEEPQGWRALGIVAPGANATLHGGEEGVLSPVARAV